MSQCNKFEGSFSGYIDGELSAETRKTLENHLSFCSNCKEVVSRLRYVRQSLSQLTPITTSSDFDFQLNQKLLSINGKPAARKFTTDYLMNWRFVTASIAVVLIALSSFMLMEPEPENVKLNNLNESSFTPNISGQDDNLLKNNKTEQTELKPVSEKEDSTSQLKKEELKNNIQHVNDR